MNSLKRFSKHIITCVKFEVSLKELAVKSKPKKSRRLKRSRSKGYHGECQLVKKLRKYGFKARRIPVSAPSREPLPDLFAIKGDVIIAFEVKSQSSEKIYFRKNQTENSSSSSTYSTFIKKDSSISRKIPIQMGIQKDRETK